MSLGICVKGPEGIVLAAESRLTLEAHNADPTKPGLFVNFDNATKLMGFSEPNNYVGVITYGLAAIGMRTAASYIPEFENTLAGDGRLTVAEFAQHLSDFYVEQWKAVMPTDYKGPDMVFVIAGYDSTEAYGRVYQIGVPTEPTPVEKHALEDFGITWGGQRDVVDLLVRGYREDVVAIAARTLKLDGTAVGKLRKALDPLQMQVPLSVMPLQDCVDLAILYIRTTIDMQRLTVGIRGCGGDIDVATVTRRDGLHFIQRKSIHGERVGG